MSDETKPANDENKEEATPEVQPEAKPEAQPEKPAEKEEVAEESKTSELRPGYKVRVHSKIQQGDKQRIQVFEGIIIAMKGQDAASRTITVRKIAAGGVGVERIWPIQSPNVEKIEVVERPKVRRSKLYYLRESLTKMKKLRERS